MFLLYSNENKIVKNSKEIINNYASSNREKNKKLFELFHLLVFLDITNFKIKKIIPNEPGDFIIESDNGSYIVEVTTIFGNRKENIIMKNMLNSIFGVTMENKDEISFNNKQMKELFLKKIKEKEEKNYKLNTNISKSFLLVVTGEYDNCPITGSWFLKFLQKEELPIKKNFDKVCILNYFASGKDGGPIAIDDFYKEFLKYKSFFSTKCE